MAIDTKAKKAVRVGILLGLAGLALNGLSWAIHKYGGYVSHSHPAFGIEMLEGALFILVSILISFIAARDSHLANLRRKFVILAVPISSVVGVLALAIAKSESSQSSLMILGTSVVMISASIFWFAGIFVFGTSKSRSAGKNM